MAAAISSLVAHATNGRTAGKNRPIFPASPEGGTSGPPAGQRGREPAQDLVIAFQSPVLPCRRQQQRVGGVLVLQLAPQRRLASRKEDGFVDRMGTEGVVPDAGALGGFPVVGVGDDDM